MTLSVEQKNFNLATADKHELKRFADESYGLPLSLAMSVETMRMHIHNHCKDNNLETPTSIAGNKEGKLVDNHQKRITINVSASEGEHGSMPIFIGLNGKGYMIPRGINVDVVPGLVEVLQNAMQDKITQDKEGELLHSSVLTYPFQIVQQAA